MRACDIQYTIAELTRFTSDAWDFCRFCDLPAASLLSLILMDEPQDIMETTGPVVTRVDG